MSVIDPNDVPAQARAYALSRAWAHANEADIRVRTSGAKYEATHRCADVIELGKLWAQIAEALKPVN